MKSGSLSEPLQALDLEPLWERTEGGLRPHPAPESAKIWRWQDIEPLFSGVIADVPGDKIERRVLTLKNPDPRYTLTTTIRNINCGIQILMPGETAPPHRHSPNALRVALEGEGGETAVNGETYPMHRGDVILTPSWTTHAHAHRGAGRVVWIDFLDVPFYRNLDQIFFEVNPDDGTSAAKRQPKPGQLHTGILPVGRFAWADVSAQLADGDGRSVYDYIDPVVGDSALTTLDCRAIRLVSGTAAGNAPSAANAVCLVIDGSGETDVGNCTLSWSRNDLFTLPQWSAVEHRTTTDTATLICVSDRPALRRLGLSDDAGIGRDDDTGVDATMNARVAG